MTRTFVVAFFAIAIPSWSIAQGPNGAVAECKNGLYVFLDTGSHTCQTAGGVRRWFVTNRPATDSASQEALTQPSPLPHDPIGAVAQCVNGWYVFQQMGTQTCDSAGGVARWLAAQSPPVTFDVPAQIDSSGHNGAIARCGNGLYIFQISGSCAGAGGIAEWYGNHGTPIAAGASQVAVARPFWSVPVKPTTDEQANAALELILRNLVSSDVANTSTSSRRSRSDSAHAYTPAYEPPSDVPESGTTYDWRSGNTYYWTHEPNGDTDVRGLNVGTGSMWHTTIAPDGSMRGTDSKFDLWRYDADTKVYINFGTGVVCTGEGLTRICTGGNRR